MESWRELLGLSSHYRLVATLSWAGGLLWFAWFALHGAPYAFLLAWGSLSMALPYGLKGITAWLNRPGAAEDAKAIAAEAAAEIAARRNGDYEATR
jgi:hypothetical protein